MCGIRQDHLKIESDQIECAVMQLADIISSRHMVILVDLVSMAVVEQGVKTVFFMTLAGNSVESFVTANGVCADASNRACDAYS